MTTSVQHYNIDFFSPVEVLNEEDTIQTRSETTGLKYHASLKEALEYAKNNEDVWKLSYTDNEGYRCRYVKAKIFDEDVWERHNLYPISKE